MLYRVIYIWASRGEEFLIKAIILCMPTIEPMGFALKKNQVLCWTKNIPNGTHIWSPCASRAHAPQAQDVAKVT